MKKLLATVVLLFIGMLIPITANAASIQPTSKDGAVGCTIRTFEETAGYISVDSGTAKLMIPENTKLIVVAESMNRFNVVYMGQSIWVDNSKVLINIKDYIPSITVSLSMTKNPNDFSMGGCSIEDLTNVALYTSKGSVNGTEAWLKYEPAKKLREAEKLFLEDGYSIIVYDAYRPYDTTVHFQKAFRSFLNTQTKSFKNDWFGELGESWFLAQNASSHNYGVALDMSLIKDGKEIEMPSIQHTLDKTSAYYYWKNANTEASNNAHYLKNIMEKVGFTYLKSEWWHFQDNDAERGNVINVPN